MLPDNNPNLSSDPALAELIKRDDLLQSAAQPIRASLNFGLGFNPEQQAKAQQLARQFNTDPMLVSDHMAEFEKASKMNGFDYSSFIKRSPMTAAWFTNPYNSALAHDDMSALADVENTLSRDHSLTDSRKRAILQDWQATHAHNATRNEFQSTLAAVESGFVDTFGTFVQSVTPNDSYLHGVAGRAMEYFASPMKRGVSAQLVDPETGQSFDNPLHSMFGRDAANSAMSVPGSLLAMSAGGKWTTPMIAWTAGQQQFEKAKAEHANPYVAALEGFMSAGVNALLMTQIPHAGPTKFAPGFSEGATQAPWVGQLREGAPSGLAAASENRITGGMAGGKFGFIVPTEKALSDSWTQAGIRAGIFGPSMAAAENMIGWMHPEGRKALTVEDVLRGTVQFAAFESVTPLMHSLDVLDNAYKLKRLTSAIEASKLKARDPEGFQEFVDSVLKDGQAETVGIPVEHFQKFFQNKGMDPAQMARQLAPESGSNYLEAVAAGFQDVQVSTAKLLTAVPHDQLTEIQQDIRLKPGVATTREYVDWMRSDEGKKAMAVLDDQAAALQPAREAVANDEPTQKVFENVKQRMVMEYGLSPDVADVYATLFARSMQRAGFRENATAWDFFQKHDINFTRQAPGESVNIFGQPESPLDNVLDQIRRTILKERNSDENVLRGELGGAGAGIAGGGETTGSPAGHGRHEGNDGRPLGLGPVPEGILYHGSDDAEVGPNGLSLAHAKDGSQLGKGVYLTDERGTTSEEGAKKYADRNGTGSLHEVAQRIKAPVDLSPSTYYTREQAAAMGVALPTFMDEIPGASLWRMLEKQHGGKEQAKQALLDAGYDSAHYLDPNGKKVWVAWKPEAVGDSRPVERNGVPVDVPWSESLQTRVERVLRDQGIDLAKVPNEEAKAKLGQILFQPETEGHRGYISLGGPDETGRRKISIGMLEQANLSTFLHELTHLHVNLLEDSAKAADASDQTRTDWQALRDFVGAKGDEPLNTEQHEELARAGEVYFSEGKAPSEVLRPVFERLKNWMMIVYRRITDQLGVHLTDEVRGAFDRMFASEAEIEQAHRAVGDEQPLFATAKDARMTPEEFKVYSEMRAKQLSEAKAWRFRQLVDEAGRKREAAWREETQTVRSEVAGQVAQESVYQTIDRLTAKETLEDGTKLKLNKKAMVERYGEDVLDDLPRKSYLASGGMDAEAAAMVLGYDSGDALVEALRSAEPRDARIDRLTEQQMVERHPEMNDAAHAEGAVQAIMNDYRATALRMELQHLRALQRETQPLRDLQKKIDDTKSDEDRRIAQEAWTAKRAELEAKRLEARSTAKEVPPLQAFKEAALRMIGQRAIKDLTPQSYLNANRQQAKAAFEAMSKGDYASAAEAKQKELLNHHLYLEAVKAQQQAVRIAQYADKAGTDNVRSKIGLAGQDFLAEWDAILDRFDFRKRTNKEIGERRQQTLNEWVEARRAEGEEPDIDPAILNESYKKNWKELTIGELQAVHDALKNIKHLADRSNSFQLGKTRVTFNEAIENLVRGARENLKVHPEPLDLNARTAMDRVVGRAKKLNSELVKFEEIVDRLDGGDINGPWRRYVFEPMCEAQYKEHELNERVTTLLAEAMGQMPKGQRLSMGDRFDIPGLGTVTRKFVLSMAMNMGNDSNQTKMFTGMGWASPEGMEAVGKALDKLNRSDWEFVQKTWDALDALWPEIRDLQVRMTGLEPERVEVRGFAQHLADGSTVSLRGGYYPLVYDPTRSTAGARQADTEIMKTEGGWSSPTTFKGHTKARVEKFSDPLLMDFEQVLAKHTTRVIKDISHREPALAIAKLFRNQAVRQSVQETLGPEYERMMMPWLKGTVNDAPVLNPEVGQWMLRLRSNMVIAGLAFRASSVLVQVCDMGRVMVGEHAVRPDFLASAAASFASNPAATLRDIRALSPEMAGRAENLDRDTRAMMRRNLGKDGLTAQAQNIGMKGLAVADCVTSATSWLGAYRQSLSEGKAQDVAVKEADRVVRLKLYGGAAKDLTEIQRKSDWGTKLITTYMGDAVPSFGMLSRAVHNIAENKKIAGSIAAVLIANMMLPLLGDMIKGKRPDDDEDAAWWAAKQMAWGLPSSIPLARDVANALQSGRDYQFSPVVGVINKGIRFGATTEQILAGEKDVEWDDYFTRAADAFGPVTGIPGTGQATTTLRYLRSPERESDPYALGLVFGPRPKQKAK